MKKDVYTLGEEKTKEAIEVEEIALYIEEQCRQAKRFPFWTIGFSPMHS